MRSGSISAPPKVCVFIACNPNAQFVMGITDPTIEGKLEGQGTMMDFNNNAWDALNGILTVVFSFIRISSSASVFFKSSRSSTIAYVAMLGLLHPLTVLTGQTFLFQNCKRGNIKLFCFLTCRVQLSWCSPPIRPFGEWRRSTVWHLAKATVRIF